MRDYKSIAEGMCAVFSNLSEVLGSIPMYHPNDFEDEEDAKAQRQIDALIHQLNDACALFAESLKKANPSFRTGTILERMNERLARERAMPDDARMMELVEDVRTEILGNRITH